MDYPSRLARIRRSMAARGLDAMLVGQPENRRYLSGYSAADHGIAESSGVLLILRRGSGYLLTDFRFKQQAEAETEGLTVLLYAKGLFALLKKLLPDLGIGRLGFESAYTLHSSAQRLFELGQRTNIDMVPLKGVVEKLRLIKSEEEIEHIRRSVLLNERVFQKALERMVRMETEIDMALEIAAELRRQGGERESFETIVAAGAASSLPHAVPGRRKIEANAPVVIDMGLVLEGYCSDMSRSFCHGKPDESYLHIHRLVRRAQLAGIDAVRAGARACDVDNAARSIIAEAGYGKYFGHALGHGVGMAVHEEPRVSPKNRKKLRAGMVITVEPGIYIPGWGGIRLEDMVVVREDGCDNLNTDATWLDI